MQKILILIGCVCLVVGIAWPWFIRLGIGRLPGDLFFKRDHFTLYLPITTSIILSIVLSLILWLLKK